MIITRKKIWLIGIWFSIIPIFIWFFSGREIFTKTKILIEKEDELFGNTYLEWQETFILGLDYTGAFSAGILLLTFLITLFIKQKKEII